MPFLIFWKKGDHFSLTLRFNIFQSLGFCFLGAFNIFFLFFILFRNKQSSIFNFNYPQLKTSIFDITFILIHSQFLPKNQYLRNKLAFSSWLSVSPNSSVLLFVDKKEFEQNFSLCSELESVFGKDRISFSTDLRKDLNEVPYVSDWFIKGLKYTLSHFVCFTNGDIILGPRWMNTTEQVFSAIGHRSFIVSERIDFNFSSHFENVQIGEKSFLANLENEILDSGHEYYLKWGMDFYAFRKDLFNPKAIPPFRAGFWGNDVWIAGWVRTFGKTVSYQRDIPCYHMKHSKDQNRYNAGGLFNEALRQINGDFFCYNRKLQYLMRDGNLYSFRRGTKVELPPPTVIF